MQPSDLLALNVNDHTEKKNGLTYLSWAWAWAEILKLDAAANFEVQTFNGMPYMSVGSTGMVWVTVTVFGKPMTCMLPVMDYKNKAIPNPDAFAVNTAIMRCLVKAIALHGLGLYIYAGEDLPEKDETLEGVTPAQTARVETRIKAAVKQIASGTPPDEASAKLFADMMLEYLALHSLTTESLSDYWKKNQVSVDNLKLNHVPLFEMVRDRFSEAKAKLTKESK
jgi:hypothetical protein